MSLGNLIGTLLFFGIAILSFVHLFRQSIRIKLPITQILKLLGKTSPWNIHSPDIIIIFLCIFCIHFFGANYIGSLFSPSFGLKLPFALAVEYLFIFSFYTLYLKFVLPSDQRLRLNTVETNFKSDLKIAISAFFVVIAVTVMINAIWNLGLIIFSDDPTKYISKKVAQLQALNEENTWALKILVSIVTIAIIPVVEEFVFRAGLYRALKSKTSRNTAIVLSSLLYALFIHNLSNFPTNVVLGATLCVLYERTGNIKAPLVLNILLAVKGCIFAILLS